MTSIKVLPMAHSPLGASSAHRWMRCPGSLTVKDDSDSEYAKKGRVSHEVARLCLELDRTPFGWVGVPAEGDGCEGIVFSQEMAEHVKQYVDHVRNVEFRPTGGMALWTEQRMVLSQLPVETGGTVDFHYVTDAGHLHIVDFKSGAIPQNPHSNPQLMIYALAAMLHHRVRPTRVTLHIVQPKADGIMQWDCTTEVLSMFYGMLKEAVERAQKVLGGTVTDEDHEEGKWCRWCPKLATCPLKHDAFVEAEEAALSGDARQWDLIERFAAMRAYMKAVEDHAKRTLADGGTVPGWELAPGKRKRVWTVDLERIRSYLAERNIALANLTPAAAIKAVPDLPEDFWRWEESGNKVLRRIESEFFN